MATLGFYGGVGNVTGANFMLSTGQASFLIDCGLVQGDRFAQAVNAEPFLYRPAEVDVLLVTHAHADHIGRIPKLVREGFVGTIYSTPPTRDLANIMLRDAVKVMHYEHERYGSTILYEESDIDDALALWKTFDYGVSFPLPDNVEARFENAGHILGSAIVHLSRAGRKVVFTGDLGNVPQPLLDAPTLPAGYHYLVMESVYGDRLHEEVAERTDLLRQYITETRQQGGTLIIPAFSLERTQGMLLEINNLIESGQIDPINVYLDSPLAITVTEVYRKYPQYLKADIRTQIAQGDDIFDFAGLSFTKSLQDSNEIAQDRGPKIIIAGSGMSHGGRIRNHEKRYLDDPTTTVLLVGYQAVGSLGRLLHDGAKKVKIDEEEVRVRARIARIRGYSGHADRDQLLGFVEHGGESAEQVFVTMGEERSSLHLVQRLRDYLGVKAVAPSLGEAVNINF